MCMPADGAFLLARQCPGERPLLEQLCCCMTGALREGGQQHNIMHDLVLWVQLLTILSIRRYTSVVRAISADPPE